VKKILAKLAWRPLQVVGIVLLQIVVVVSLFGLAMSAAGLIFDYPYLYWLGLRLSCALFIIVLPTCIVLVALMPLAGCFTIVTKMIDSYKKRSKEC